VGNDGIGRLRFRSDSFSFEMEKDTAECRALNRDYIVRVRKVLLTGSGSYDDGFSPIALL